MKEIPKTKLAHLPTPIEELKRLSNKLGGPRIFVKRDDQTGVAFGGNKVRKLEYLVADAIKNGCKTLITAGAIQSNHCRQTAAVARMVGMDCILILGGDEPVSPEANTYLDVLLGAEIHWTSRDQIKSKLKNIYQKAVDEKRQPYMVPYGGSSPLGAVSYAFALEELLKQKTDLDWIVFATSSGGTHAGLHAGKILLGSDVKILGISIDESSEDVKNVVSKLAEDVCTILGEKRVVLPEEILVNDDYLGAGYAVIGENEIEAIKLFAREEALLLDPVYTGRAAAGMIDLIRKRFFNDDDNILFWHTGGAPALFVDEYRKKILKGF